MVHPYVNNVRIYSLVLAKKQEVFHQKNHSPVPDKPQEAYPLGPHTDYFI